MGVVSIGVSRESKNCENFFWSLWWHFRESLHLRKFPTIRYYQNPKRCLPKYVDKTNCAPGHSTSKFRPPACRKAERSPKHLEGDNKRPMGVCQGKGLSDRLPVQAPAKHSASHVRLLCRAEPVNRGGGKRTSGQGSHSRSAQPSGRVLFKPLPGPKKRWRSETSDKLEGSEQLRSCIDNRADEQDWK